MKKWRCTICDYVHEGETPPEECPVCGAGSDAFVPHDEVSAGQESFAGASPKQSANGPVGQAETAVFKLSYGLFIVSSVTGDKLNGQACNTVFQITSQPLRLAIGINKNNLTHEYIKSSGIVGISILGQDGHDLVRRFGYKSGRELDKFAGIEYKLGITGAPLVNGAIAYLEGKINPELSVDVGTHTLFIVDVLDGEVKEEREPMTYAYFRKTK